jgi:ankyrin repeat protein
MAIGKGFPDLLSLLIGKGTDVNIKDRYNQTPLHLATGIGAVQAVETLIKAGANVNCKGPADLTPLFNAIKFKHRKIAEALITAGADVNAVSQFGTPLALAVRAGDDDFQMLLKENGAHK